MRVLVTAASKHGASEEIAERIGAVLAAHGVEVDVKQLQDVGGLGGYEAVVLGSGIYLGKWLKEQGGSRWCCTRSSRWPRSARCQGGGCLGLIASGRGGRGTLSRTAPTPRPARAPL